jgi:hypothetical protein
MNKSEFIKTAFRQGAKNFVKEYVKKTPEWHPPMGENLMRKAKPGEIGVRQKGLFGSGYELNDRGKGLAQGLGVGAAGTAGGGILGGLSGYEQGNEAGYASGMDRGLGQGYELAAHQANNTPFLKRLMGKYNYDPSQLQAMLNQGLGDDHRSESRHGPIRRALPLF